MRRDECENCGNEWRRELTRVKHRLSSALCKCRKLRGQLALAHDARDSFLREAEEVRKQAESHADLLREQLAEARRQCDVYRAAWEREQQSAWRRLCRWVGRSAL